MNTNQMETLNGKRQSVSLLCSILCLLAPFCGHAQMDAFQEAETYWRDGEMQKVVWTYQKELSKPLSDNERVLFLTRLAMAQMASENFDSGMAAYQEIAQRYPGHPYAPTAMLFQANYAILEKSQLSKGLQIYADLITKYPKSEAAQKAGLWVPQLRKMTSAELVKKNRERRQQQAEVARLAEKKAKADLKKAEKDSKP